MHFGFALDVFKTSWKTKNCYAEDVLKTPARHVFKTSSRRLEDQQMFAGLLVRFPSTHITIPLLPPAKFFIPSPSLTVTLFEKPWTFLKGGINLR